MYVTLTDIQNGESVYLTRSLSGELEVALCELTYYHLWHNIRGTERVSNEHTTMLVLDGYYNAHELDEEVFKPLGGKLHLDTHTGLLQLTTKNDKILWWAASWPKSWAFPKILLKPKKCALGMVRPDPAKHTPLTSHTGWPSIGRSTFILLNWVPPKTWLTASPVRCSDLFPYSRRKRKMGCRENNIISSLAI